MLQREIHLAITILNQVCVWYSMNLLDISVVQTRSFCRKRYCISLYIFAATDSSKWVSKSCWNNVQGWSRDPNAPPNSILEFFPFSATSMIIRHWRTLFDPAYTRKSIFLLGQISNNDISFSCFHCLLLKFGKIQNEEYRRFLSIS